MATKVLGINPLPSAAKTMAATAASATCAAASASKPATDTALPSPSTTEASTIAAPSMRDPDAGRRKAYAPLASRLATHATLHAPPCASASHHHADAPGASAHAVAPSTSSTAQKAGALAATVT